MIINFIKKYSQVIITIIIISLIILSCLFTSVICDSLDLHMYFGWKEISINDSISFKIPGNWESSKKDGLLYFYDKNEKNDNNIVLFQSETSECFQIGDSVKINSDLAEKNVCSDNFLSIVSLNSSVNSLGTISGEALVSFDGKSQVEDYIVFNDHKNDFVFYTYKRNVDDDTLEKICDSVQYKDR